MANLTPTEIYDRLDALVARAPSPEHFGLELMEAVGAPPASITRARNEAEAGSFAWTRMLTYQAVEVGNAVTSLERMTAEADSKPKSRRPRLLVAYDGDAIAARDTKMGDTLSVALDLLPPEAEFFFPLGGLERYVPAPERLADVKATKRVSRLYDAVRDANPDWNKPKHRHALNVFMTRLLFCLFAERVGIFETHAFTSALTSSTNADGSDLGTFLDGAFAHMNTRPEDAPAATRGWSKLPYVNGGLFREVTPMPTLDGRCRRFLIECGRLDWRTINPDIFGSMLQAVVDVSLRGELGMHYTSPTNIRKVLDPIILDDLRAELEAAGKNRAKLQELQNRLRRIRIFDPACGSGNFLIIAFKELRAIEMEVCRRLGEMRLPMVTLDQFYGIEIDDFACNTARLGLWIAEYQENELYRKSLGKAPPALPLTDAGTIVCDNATRIDWTTVCPHDDTSEIIVVGNPQFKGATWQSDRQKDDMAATFSNRLRKWGELDYVAAWFALAADYSVEGKYPFAFVATNSICQGVQVATLWPYLLRNCEIQFAYQSFKWKNLATKNAGITCVIVGVGSKDGTTKRLYQGDTVRHVRSIGPYLVPDTTVIVEGRSDPIGALQPMVRGNQPTDGGNLLLSRAEKDDLLKSFPSAERFMRRLYGSQELLQAKERWCIWVQPNEVEDAKQLEPLTKRFEAVRQMRKASKKVPTQRFADFPWSFEQQNESQSHTIFVPRPSSERREYIPVEVMHRLNIPSSECFAIFDGEIWQAAILSSRMHRLWLETVGGRLKEDPRYSNTLVWNTFPFPSVSLQRKEILTEHWWEIDLARKEDGFDRPLGDLYAKDKMSSDLRRAHEDLDRTVEAIFGSRKYRSDADRIEHMLNEYEKLIAAEAA